MKNTNNQQQGGNPQHANMNKHRPENKDNLDSRSGEEQDYKGDDQTHNKRDHQSKKASTDKNNSK